MEFAGIHDGCTSALTFDAFKGSQVDLTADACDETHAIASSRESKQVVEKRILEAEREIAWLRESLEASRHREVAAVEQSEHWRVEAERLQNEVHAAQERVLAAEAGTGALRKDALAARGALLRELRGKAGVEVVVARHEETGPTQEASLADLVASVVEARGHQSPERSDAGALPIGAARELLALGQKLWRLQQAQCTVGAGDCPAGGTRDSWSKAPRLLHATPQPRRAGDDIAAKLLTEMSQALRKLEQGMEAPM